LRLSEEERHHIYKVLRGGEGDRIEVVDGLGRLFVAELTRKGEVTLLEKRPVADSAGGAGVEVTLYQAVPKGRHMDVVVEKATELGVTRIVPLMTDRGVVKLPERDGKTRRWRRVAGAAARQSLQLRVPEVAEAAPFAETARKAGELGILLHNEPGLPLLEDVVAPGVAVGLFVGPEGGWSEGELAVAREVGLALASLGPYRLRSETAGIAAVARACAVQERARSVAGSATRSVGGSQ
jgi:16S rRNA (uracil1498-N3)-methyltransferase